MLQSMGLQRVGYNLVTEQKQQQDIYVCVCVCVCVSVSWGMMRKAFIVSVVLSLIISWISNNFNAAEASIAWLSKY